MADLFIVNLGGEDGDARAAERLRLRTRYKRFLVSAAGLDEAAAERVMSVLFDHVDDRGRDCSCSCHPRLDSLHDDGFDCPCTWDETRRAESRRGLEELWDTPGAQALREQHEAEERAVAHWLEGQPDVEAQRITAYAPEQWEGTVDGHSFYFRERHGQWRLELDLEETGEFANRLVDAGEDGELVTEPVPLRRGTVIAEGTETQLGDDPVGHLAFIVRTIRDHLWGQSCDHAGALFFCPSCGTRMSGPT